MAGIIPHTFRFLAWMSKRTIRYTVHLLISMQLTQKLLDQVRDAIRLKHYAYRTEEAYVH